MVRASLVVLLLVVATACATSPLPSPHVTPLPSNPDGMPAGVPTSIDQGVEIAADNLLVTLRFIGGPVLPRNDPCYTEYAGWARPAPGDALQVAVILVVDIRPTPSVPVCAAVGESREVQVILDKPFLGTVADDQFGSTMPITRPFDPTRALEPPDSIQPAAGICLDPQPGLGAEFQLNVDTPQPRCGKVWASQRLSVVNTTLTQVTVTFAGSDYDLPSGAGFGFQGTFGSVWQPGVHVLHTSFYGGGGPEIWLVAE